MGQSVNVGRGGWKAEAVERYILPELGLLFRVALSLTRNHSDAEDLVQETLLRAYRTIENFDGEHPRAWLLTILRHAHINSHRRRRPQLLADPESALRAVEPSTDASQQPERLVVDEQFDGAVAGAYRALPERFRQVVELVDVYGLSYQEAAEVLSIPVGTIMSRLHRARSRMRKRLVAEGFTRGRRR